MGVYGGNKMINVLIWAEDRPLPEHADRMRKIYPHGIEGRLKEILENDTEIKVRTATMQDEEQGLKKNILQWADVLIFWSHKHWRELEDCHVKDVCGRVLDGMGIIFLHSAHASKIFSALMGTRTQILNWRENDECQRYWIMQQDHPIVKGINVKYFEIPKDETYWEYFEIPQPEEQIFITVTENKEIFRSGCCWKRGKGNIFYMQAGHETYPVYYQKEIMQILVNAVKWAYISG